MTTPADRLPPRHLPLDVPEIREKLATFRPDLVRLASRRLKGRLPSRVDPSDVVQQTLMEAHESLSGFRGDDHELWPWLAQILKRNVANLIRDHVFAQRRSTTREQGITVANDHGSPALATSEQSSPSQKAIRLESDQQLAAALAQLPPDQQTALRMRHFEKKSLAEIAVFLDRSPAAAAGLVKRGLSKLREILSESGGPLHD